MFFDKTCTISQTTYVKVGGSSKRVNAPIYTDIECNFEIKREQIKDTNLGRNSDVLRYVVVIPITYDLVRENYTVELIDPDLGTKGDFIINDVQADRSIGGGIDCITFIAKEITGQL